MRVIQTYTFKMSSKIPYSDYPEIVHRYLEDQNLVARRFLYFFKELVISYGGCLLLDKGACAKAVKDCPALGESRSLDVSGVEERILSNIDVDTSCTEADVLPHMKKIHRKYGFAESDLYYCDIDFFDNVIPWERDMPSAEDGRGPLWLLQNQPYGSCIRLHRYSTGGNYISLSVDILHNGKIHDAAPYCDAMKALLPNIRPTVSMKFYLSDAEKQEIARWDGLISPVVEKARSFFLERFPVKTEQNLHPSNYNIAPKLKKLAKQYGFSYHYEGNGIYSLEKRTARGHVLQLSVDSGPSHFDAGYAVAFRGLGFEHVLGKSIETPKNQAEFDEYSEKVFSVVAEFEKNFIEELDSFYEETPGWFICQKY